VSDPLTALFAEVLEIPADGLDDASSPDSVPQWDSLAAMNLVAVIEESYGVRLSTREIMRMTSIGLARTYLRAKGLDV
jgi:acyl carrier protein